MFYIWPVLILTIIVLPKVLATREGRVAVVVIAGVVGVTTLAVQFVRVRRFLALNGQPSNTPLAAA